LEIRYTLGVCCDIKIMRRLFKAEAPPRDFLAQRSGNRPFCPSQARGLYTYFSGPCCRIIPLTAQTTALYQRGHKIQNLCHINLGIRSKDTITVRFPPAEEPSVRLILIMSEYPGMVAVQLGAQTEKRLLRGAGAQRCNPH
jgi:hypothetical protein